MNCCKLYVKLYRLIFMRKIVFSQSDEQVLPMVGDLKNLRLATEVHYLFKD